MSVAGIKVACRPKVLVGMALDLRRELENEAADDGELAAQSAHGIEASNLNLQHLLIEEQKRAERLILCARGTMITDGKVREERFDSDRAHRAGMPNAVKADVAFDPIDIRFLRAERVVFESQDMSNVRPLRHESDLLYHYQNRHFWRRVGELLTMVARSELINGSAAALLVMATREEFLRQVWDDVINGPMTGAWIDNTIAAAKKDSTAPFADAGAALERLVAAGADRRDLSLASRFAIYEAVFSLLYMLDDPGVDDGDVFLLQESLLGADPSGKEGRPGSAP
jgi:hypothetical protein